MNKDSQTILNNINKIRRHSIAAYSISGAVLILSLLMSISMIGAYIGYIITLSFLIKLTYFTASSIALLYAAKVSIFGRIYPIFNNDAIVFKLEKNYANFNGTLISAVQFIKSNTLKTKKFSPYMLSLLLKDAACKSAMLKPSCMVQKKHLKLNFIIFSAIFTIFIVQYVINSSHFIDNLNTIFTTTIEPTNIGPLNPDSSDLHPLPLLGDITLDYTYPFYTGLAPKTVTNSSGDIEAIKGSEVKISAICKYPLKTANIVLDKKLKVPLKITDDNKLTCEIKLMEDGIYSFEMLAKNEKLASDYNPLSIKIIKDLDPQIAIINPKKKISVSEKDSVKLEHESCDDFGLKEISLHYNINDLEENNIILHSFKNNRKTFKNTYQWDLNPLSLKSGDNVTYHLEVKDNDTVSDPKIPSDSQIYHLEVYSYNEKHKEIIDLQAALSQEMSNLLSDELTSRKEVVKSMEPTDSKIIDREQLIYSRENIYEKAKNVISMFDKTINEMTNDVLANYSVYYILNNVRDSFRELMENNMSAFWLNETQTKKDTSSNIFPTVTEKLYSKEIAFLEKNIPLLDELLKKQKLEEFLATSSELNKSREDIERLLDTLKNNPDIEIDEKTMNELKNIRNTLKTIMEKLASLSKKFMEKYLNNDDRNSLESAEMQEELQNMENAFQNKDLNSALMAAKQLLNSLEKTIEKFKYAAFQNTKPLYSKLFDKIEGALEQITELESEERELTLKTEELKKNVTDRTYKSMDNLFEEFFKKQKERLTIISTNISEMGDSVSQLSHPTTTQLPTLNIPTIFSYDAVEKSIPQIKDKISYLFEMLDGWDVPESLKLSKETLWRQKRLYSEATKITNSTFINKIPHLFQQTTNLNSSIDLNKLIVNDLTSFLESLKQQELTNLTNEEKTILNEYSESQSLLQNRTATLQNTIKELQKQIPVLNDDVQNKIGEASNSMKLANNKLNHLNLPVALVHERESLYFLEQAKNSVEQTKKMIANSLTPGEMPIPFPIPRFQGIFKQGSNGMYGASTENVEIPTGDKFTVPKEFREDILKGMSGSFPAKYETLNKSYFLKLLK